MSPGGEVMLDLLFSNTQYRVVGHWYDDPDGEYDSLSAFARIVQFKRSNVFYDVVYEHRV